MDKKILLWCDDTTIAAQLEHYEIFAGWEPTPSGIQPRQGNRIKVELSLWNDNYNTLLDKLGVDRPVCITEPRVLRVLTPQNIVLVLNDPNIDGKISENFDSRGVFNRLTVGAKTGSLDFRHSPGNREVLQDFDKTLRECDRSVWT